MNKKKPNSNNIDARVHLDFKLMKSTSHLGIDNKNPSNNWIDAHVGSGGPMQKLKKEGVDALIDEINLVFSKSYKEENRTGSNREANNNEIKKRINTFKENVRKAFENINLHIDILKIKPEYATILQTYIAAEKNLDDYYKSKTEAYFSNKGIASPIPENEWSYPNNGKSKTFDDLKDQVTVGIGNRKNISFVKDYFTNTDYFGGEGSKGVNWKNNFADERKKIIQQVKSKFLKHIADGLPLDQDITTGETFGDKIKLIQTDFKQFIDMIKDDYIQKVVGKYGVMNNIKNKIEAWVNEKGDLHLISQVLMRLLI